MPPAHAYAAYRTAEVETLTQRDLIVKLYQGAERFLLQAKMGMENKQIENATVGCQKAKRIFVELLSTLNFESGGEIADQLRDLYLFIVSQIVEANLQKDPQMIGELLPIIATLRGAWEEIPAEHANTSSLKEEHVGQTFHARI